MSAFLAAVCSALIYVFSPVLRRSRDDLLSPPTPKCTHLQLIQGQSAPPPTSFKRLVHSSAPRQFLNLHEETLVSFRPAPLLLDLRVGCHLLGDVGKYFNIFNIARWLKRTSQCNNVTQCNAPSFAFLCSSLSFYLSCQYLVVIPFLPLSVSLCLSSPISLQGGWI